MYSILQSSWQMSCDLPERCCSRARRRNRTMFLSFLSDKLNDVLLKEDIKHSSSGYRTFNSLRSSLSDAHSPEKIFKLMALHAFSSSLLDMAAVRTVRRVVTAVACRSVAKTWRSLAKNASCQVRSRDRGVYTSSPLRISRADRSQALHCACEGLRKAAQIGAARSSSSRRREAADCSQIVVHRTLQSAFLRTNP